MNELFNIDLEVTFKCQETTEENPEEPTVKHE